MPHTIDEGALRGVLEESQDLHADAMRTGREGLDDYVDAAHEAAAERRRRGISRGAVVTGVAGAGLIASAFPAFADSDLDVQMLQTAASLENLAVATYEAALGLPFIGGGAANGVVKTFAETTMRQHGEHAQGFNAAAVKLGGRRQTKPNPKYLPVVEAAKPKLTSASAVVDLAVTLEDVATQTYVKNVSEVSTPELRQLFASIAGVEAQHRATLLAVRALLRADLPELIALPPDAAKLPAAAGSVAFPNAFYPTDMASPADEGAVK